MTTMARQTDGILTRTFKLVGLVAAGLGIGCALLVLYMGLTKNWVYKMELAYPDQYPIGKYYGGHGPPVLVTHPPQESKFIPYETAPGVAHGTCCQLGSVDGDSYDGNVESWWTLRDACTFGVACVFRGVGRMGEHAWSLPPNGTAPLERKAGQGSAPGFVFVREGPADEAPR